MQILEIEKIWMGHWNLLLNAPQVTLSGPQGHTMRRKVHLAFDGHKQLSCSPVEG